MTSVTVGGDVIPIYPAGIQAQLTLFNNGPSTVYLGENTSVSLLTGFPLSAGSAIVWDANKPLFVVAGTGNASTLYYMENSGQTALGSIAFAPGTTVGLDPNATVGIAGSLPPSLSTFWPCVTGENYPPVFGCFKMAYGQTGAQPSVQMQYDNSTTNVHNAQWNRLARYAPDSLLTPLVITFLLYLPLGTGFPAGVGPQPYVSPLFIGFPYTVPTGPGTVINGLRLGSATAFGSTAQNFYTAYLDINGHSTSVDLTPIAQNYSLWMHVELVYASTGSRLTINGDTNMRVSNVAVSDASLLDGYGFTFGTPSGVNSNRQPLSNGNVGAIAISNLYSQYPATIPD